MLFTPLIFRTCASDAIEDDLKKETITLEELLPTALEVNKGVAMHTKTFLTDVKRETTDEN